MKQGKLSGVKKIEICFCGLLFSSHCFYFYNKHAEQIICQYDAYDQFCLHHRDYLLLLAEFYKSSIINDQYNP